MIAHRGADFEQISKDFNISPVTARLIRNRGVIGTDSIRKYLRGNLNDIHSPYELTDIKKASELLLQKIKQKSKIRIIGDYDVDGVCSTYILWAGIRRAGGNVDYRLPDRILDGYGLNERLVEEAKADGIDTIITCDNGIAAKQQVDMAKKYGMTVIITDHHEVPFDKNTSEQILPNADVVVDPKRQDCDMAFKEICGAVVAYKFLQVMFDENSFENSEFFKEMIEFAAMATVCDVMPLEDENRIIVKEGLKEMRNSHNTGLKALILVNNIDSEKISSYTLGFVLGPCLNATGRLDTAMRGMALLTSTDENTAVTIASELKALNDSRKTMTQEGVEKASNEMETVDKIPKVIVLYQPDLHESIAGIVAGKVKEKYNRPTIVLTNAHEGAKGSGRSIENYDMFRELSACKDLFTKFGGHKMAAGLSLPIENIDILRRKLNDNCELTENDFTQVKYLDMELPLWFLNMDMVKEFDLLEPYGNGNSKPIFAVRDVSIISGRIMGKNKNCGKYKIVDSRNNQYEMVYFGDMEKWHDFLISRYGNDICERMYNKGDCKEIKVNVAYYPDINSWQGRESLQIVMTDFC